MKLPIKVLDGGLATELERRGFSIKDPLWSAKALLEKPELIDTIQLDYLKAGADIISSAGYQLTQEGLQKRGLTEDEIESIFRRSIPDLETFRRNLGRDFEFALSMGPYGAYLADGSEYQGNYKVSDQELSAFHERRLDLYAEILKNIPNSEDFWFAFETVPERREAEILLELVLKRKLKRAWISVSLKDPSHLSDGTPLTDWTLHAHNTTKNLKSEFSLGINCVPPSFLKSAVSEIRSVSDLSVFIYPNRGEKYDAVSKQWLEPKDAPWGDFLIECLPLGIQGVGGCCRTTPEDIQQLRQWTKLARSKLPF